MERTVIVDSSIAIQEWDRDETTAPCNTRASILGAYELRIRARMSRLSSDLYWRAMGHPGVVHLVDKLENATEENRLDALQEMLTALDYAVSQCEGVVRKRIKTRQ